MKRLDNDDEDESPASAPAWMVSYGDLMSLLLTMFVMLISMSEVKQNDRFQGVADSMREQFSTNLPASANLPEGLRPRNAALAVLAVSGRATRQAVMAATAALPTKAVEEPQARIVLAGGRTTIGASIEFGASSGELSSATQEELRRIAALFDGKPQRIEVRGLVDANAPVGEAANQDPLDLAYQRARAVARVLVEDLGIDAVRIRLAISTTGGATGTTGTAGTPVEKPRVEVFLLDELSSTSP